MLLVGPLMIGGTRMTDLSEQDILILSECARVGYVDRTSDAFKKIPRATRILQVMKDNDLLDYPYEHLFGRYTLTEKAKDLLNCIEK